MKRHPSFQTGIEMKLPASLNPFNQNITCRGSGRNFKRSAPVSNYHYSTKVLKHFEQVKGLPRKSPVLSLGRADR